MEGTHEISRSLLIGISIRFKFFTIALVGAITWIVGSTVGVGVMTDSEEITGVSDNTGLFDCVEEVKFSESEFGVKQILCEQDTVEVINNIN